MRLLVLGGTEFVGRALVEEGLSRGWDVTTFNRGTRQPLPGVTPLVGDRTDPQGLAALKTPGLEWDIVADTWSWAPSAVRDTARVLKDDAGRYVYVSSCSVYRFPTEAGSAENAPLVNSSPDDETFDDYARAKAGAERAVLDAFGDRSLLARPGLILGPHENIGRLPWWLLRAARGGSILAPGKPNASIQYIDARDLASWSLGAAQNSVSGPVNVISEPAATTMGELLTSCLDATDSTGHLEWTSTETVLNAGIEPWTQLPIWLPPGEVHDTMFNIDVSKAMSAGLTIRPITETVHDTWNWLQSIGGVPPQRADRPPVGLAPELEAGLLGS
ncbi:NAD-dependent epimerase/dehydratase family protein [Mycetocola zhadangensis]|uniref:NAD-dependent epimerase/dehydratase family protein n=1 Tax=Mycetocola zhadangensis TaxID=1164595 RepID=A0A3L7J6C8_9MICO|nr:NAD-dependent epimerase/dehydratase family protein [Mycetocola zhadangensis]RLQ86237.1 NAD-dependent epimerase/dehydratase family protein [Mycetocola zhadangensis]GGE89487.1 reductase [Mycetocola zhadangensis]